MRMYTEGDQVEVLNRNGRLEDSWHPARIVKGHGDDVYSVVYDGHVNGVVVEERVLLKCIRPRPPLVEFENWSRGDLVHVFDNFAWKLATVLEVLGKKQFLARVVGSMKDLKVDIASIRVRHYWQDDYWIVVGKGPSSFDAQRQRQDIHRNMISDSQIKQRNTSIQASRRSTRQTYHNVATKAVKRSAPSILDQTDAHRASAKIIRAAERTSFCTFNPSQTEVCTVTHMILKVSKKHRGMSPLTATNSTLREQQYEIHEYSGLSSVGSCSINFNRSSDHHHKKCAELQRSDDLSDAESCTSPSLAKRTNQTAGIFISERAILGRPAKGCGMVLRFRLQNPLLPGRAL